MLSSLRLKLGLDRAEKSTADLLGKSHNPKSVRNEVRLLIKTYSVHDKNPNYYVLDAYKETY